MEILDTFDRIDQALVPVVMINNGEDGGVVKAPHVTSPWRLSCTCNTTLVEDVFDVTFTMDGGKMRRSN